MFHACLGHSGKTGQAIAGDVRAMLDILSLLDSLATRIVAPLYPIDTTAQPIRRLNPAVTLKGKDYYLATQELTALRRKSLGKSVASLSHMRSELFAALDLLITGV